MLLKTKDIKKIYKNKKMKKDLIKHSLIEKALSVNIIEKREAIKNIDLRIIADCQKEIERSKADSQ